jgi:hypothetical protein
MAGIIDVLLGTLPTKLSNYLTIWADTADKKVKVVDANDVVSILNNDGPRDANILTNGGFRVLQKVAAASTAIAGISTTTRAGVIADCWSVTASVASNLNWAQIDTQGAPETGLKSRFYGSIISSSAGKKVMLSQWVLNAEMAHLRGQKVRLSIKLNQKVGSAAQVYKLGLLQLNSSGTVDVSPAFLSGAWSTTGGVNPSWGTNLVAITPDTLPAGENGTIVGDFLEISGQATTWVRSSCVFTVPTTAKNLVAVLFSNATGGTTDNLSHGEFDLTEGPDIVDWVEPPYADTLMRCLRRYCKSFQQTTVPATNAGVVNVVNGIIGKAAATALACKIPIRFPVPMWKSPTVTLFNPSAANAQVRRIDGTTPADQTATAQLHLGDAGVLITATGDANGAVGDTIGVHYTADAEITA